MAAPWRGALPPAEATALVIGAGLAGAAVTQALCQRGFRVTLLDAGSGPAHGASALPVGMLSPHTTAQPTPLSRLCEVGVALTRSHLERLLPEGHGWQACEVDNHRHDPGRWPAAMVRPGALVQAWLDQAEATGLLQTCWHARVERLNRRSDGQWQALEAQGAPWAEAPVVVVASAHGSARLLSPWVPAPELSLPLRPVKGQLSWGHLMGAPLAERPQRLNGVFIPRYTERCAGDAAGWRDIWAMGSTYDRGQDNTEVTADAHQRNGRHLAEIDAEIASQLQAQWDATPGALQGWAGVRCATLDRLPLVGALPQAWSSPGAKPPRRPALHDVPRWAGLYTLCGLGSRGLALAALCGETLGDQISGHAASVGHVSLLAPDLGDALDPARFLWRRWHTAAS